MNKPQAHDGHYVKTQAGYDIYEMVSYLEARYEFDSLDILGSQAHIDNWYASHGYTGLDPDGLEAHCSKIWYAHFALDPGGEKLWPHMVSFWDWFMERHLFEYNHSFYFSISEYLNKNETPKYILPILEYMKQEFGENFELFYSR